MKPYSGAALALLASGVFVRRQLIWVEMPSENVGFWDDAYDAVIEGRTYLATYGAIQISPRTSAADLGARDLTLAVNALEGAIIAPVLAEAYHQRPIFVSEALISPETQQVISLDQWFAGWINQIPRKERLNGEARLEVQCAGIGREFSRSGARTRSDADQRQLDSNDAFFNQVVAANNVPQQWGRTTAKKPGGIAGFLDKIF